MYIITELIYRLIAGQQIYRLLTKTWLMYRPTGSLQNRGIFLCFIGEERKALDERERHLLSLFYQEIVHCMESFNS